MFENEIPETHFDALAKLGIFPIRGAEMRVLIEDLAQEEVMLRASRFVQTECDYSKLLDTFEFTADMLTFHRLAFLLDYERWFNFCCYEYARNRFEDGEKEWKVPL